MLSTRLELHSSVTYNAITTLVRTGFLSSQLAETMGLHGWKNLWMNKLHIPLIHALKKLESIVNSILVVAPLPFSSSSILERDFFEEFWGL